MEKRNPYLAYSSSKVQFYDFQSIFSESSVMQPSVGRQILLDNRLNMGNSCGGLGLFNAKDVA
jgi:hypothetical protein